MQGNHPSSISFPSFPNFFPNFFPSYPSVPLPPFVCPASSTNRSARPPAGGQGGPGRHRVVYALLVINKAGGLIYQREFHAGLLRLSSNDYLVLAGTFHGVHAITRSLTPRLPIGSGSGGSGSGGSGGSGGTESVRPVPGAPLSGLEVLETERFRMTCFQTVTGLKFLLFTDPTMTNVDGIMHKVYELYADYVMKNPFYQLDMPVRCEAFDRHLGGWLNTRGYATIS